MQENRERCLSLTFPEVAPADDNPWGIRAQYELDFFNEILDWAENIVRQNEEDEQKQ